MSKAMSRVTLIVFILLLACLPAYAGQIVEVTCNDCGFNAGQFFLDSGELGGTDMVLAYCSVCNSIIVVNQLKDRSQWVCPNCGADSSNIHLDGDEIDGAHFKLHCPKCGSENLKRERVGFWD
jgi:predicted RNA-binding Zn-ribbon protein involved in translation (DUF1610 family)